jgi:hypothetical protein
MDVIISIGSPTANSYLTVEEMDAYIGARPGFDGSVWVALPQATKEFELVLAAQIEDGLSFRGERAVLGQAMAFPRIMPDSPLFIEDRSGKFMPYTDWEALCDYAGLTGCPIPVIPDGVKSAQAEIAFQVVHSHLMTLEPFGTGEMDITSLGIDVISLSFGKGVQSDYNLFSKDQMGAISVVRMYLQKYLAAIRGAVI